MSHDCECGPVGPVEVEITSEPMDPPCMEAFWLRWICRHGIVTWDGSLKMIAEGMV